MAARVPTPGRTRWPTEGRAGAHPTTCDTTKPDVCTTPGSWRSQKTSAPEVQKTSVPEPQKASTTTAMPWPPPSKAAPREAGEGRTR